MQSTGIGRGTAEKPWQELPDFLWLIVGVKQMKQGPQSLVIGIPQGDIWVWKFLHAWFAHIRGGSSCWHWEKLWKYLVSRSLFISHGSWVSFDFALNVYILSMRDHMEGTTLALWQWREGRNKIYLRHWAMLKMIIELKQRSRVLKHIYGVRIESCRFSSVAQKVGNNPSKKNTYYHHILTLQQLRAPQQQWLSRSYPLPWLLLIQQGSSLRPIFLMFLVF